MAAARAFYATALGQVTVEVIVQTRGSATTSMAAARQVGEALVVEFGEG